MYRTVNISTVGGFGKMAKRKIKIRHLLCLLFLIYVLSTFIYQQFRIMDLTKQEAELNAKKRRPLSKEKSSKKK